MVGYIRQIASDIQSFASTFKVNEIDSIKTWIDLLPALAEELNRLDPRDFTVGVQYAFVHIRLRARKYASELPPEKYSQKMADWNPQWRSTYVQAIASMASETIEVLKEYAGEGSRSITREVSFVSDAKLRAIIERDYRELAVILFPGGAWKSTVIMAGSILEATLFDVLANDPTRQAAALASSKAPRHSGRVLPLADENWKLVKLIEVASDIGVLPATRANTIDQVLRDYRNFVHPNKEVRSQHQCDEPEALLAKGALDGVLDYLTRTL